MQEMTFGSHVGPGMFPVFVTRPSLWIMLSRPATSCGLLIFLLFVRPIFRFIIVPGIIQDAHGCAPFECSVRLLTCATEVSEEQ